MDSDVNKLKTNNLNVVHYNVFSLMAEGRLDFLSKECNKMHPCIHDDDFPSAGDFKSIRQTFESFAKSKNSYFHNY